MVLGRIPVSFFRRLKVGCLGSVVATNGYPVPETGKFGSAKYSTTTHSTNVSWECCWQEKKERKMRRLKDLYRLSLVAATTLPAHDWISSEDSSLGIVFFLDKRVTL